MKKAILILLMVPLLVLAQKPATKTGSQQPQTEYVNKKKFDQFKKEIYDSIKTVSHKVEMGKETLHAAKEYSDKTLDLIEWFKDNFLILLALISFIIYLIWGVHIKDIKKSMGEEKEKIKDDFSKLMKEERIKALDNYKSSINEFKDKYIKQLERLLETEEASMEIKYNAQLLFLLPKEYNKDFDDLKRIIMKVYKKDEKVVLFETKEQIFNNKDFNNFLEQDTFPKCVIITDDFFTASERIIKSKIKNEFEKFEKKVKQVNSKIKNIMDDFMKKERKYTIDDIEKMKKNISNSKLTNFIDNLLSEHKEENEVFDILIEKEIGIALYGDEKLPSKYKKYKYRGYANSQYSFYSNLNNLLKYMYYDKKFN